MNAAVNWLGLASVACCLPPWLQPAADWLHDDERLNRLADQIIQMWQEAVLPQAAAVSNVSRLQWVSVGSSGG